MRTMCLFVPALVLTCLATTVYTAEDAKDDKAVAAAIEKLGGKVRFDDDKLVEVNLEGKRISDDDLKLLKPLRHLRKLDLEETPITDEGLKHLSGLTSLEHLDLEETRVTDAGMDHLKGLKNLKVINLDDTRVTKRGEQILKDAIPGLKIDR
jgi:hypothetical protein